jgi:hypothetical protein
MTFWTMRLRRLRRLRGKRRRFRVKVNVSR